ncbi:WD40 repeat-like protein [Tothia fuscella]|uniref:WD40 repeat-like protein n=1 Tax=Tothia fuscella TaxID=1048955 RepID=A0A9P4P222_9PEZI|nr:WD40 repeat-like protein [Tothia fuscella]
MKLTLPDRLLKRELGNTNRYSRAPGIYGDTAFIRDLDIVNELSGHSGCVNALSWSRSGSLLASGSDDKAVNIYSYLPDNSTKQLELATTIDTGHTRNIFSVKFMPHSNDRTIVTAAGDREVRVFDIERASFSGGGHQRLSTNSTNAKVFRSHNGPVKRIVTEASPFYFMSCSEDGDVRQWDVRQPESTYPKGYGHRRPGSVPPPLISYSPYNIDLYTISCSPSQPHYIALGGTHLHCFLHDRRMLGRDKLRERGGLLTPSNSADDSALEAATRCVRKFAPHGQPKMSRNDSKTITACKISDANPNEIIVSWSGDFIYSFNILQDEEDAAISKAHHGFTESSRATRAKQEKDRKRKRPRAGSQDISQEGENRAGSHPRTSGSEAETQQGNQELSLLFRMDNGENVEIPLPAGAVSDSQLMRSEEPSNGIAKEIKELRSLILDPTGRQQSNTSDEAKAAFRQRMERTLVLSLKIIEKIDGIMHNWSYPITESSSAIAFQQKLRDDRGKTWRFVQACGTVSRVASRRPHDAGPRRLLDYFDIIRSSPRETSLHLERHEQFGYDFIKTVLLWLDSGVGAVLREFTCEPDDPSRSNSKRRPITKDSGLYAIEEQLIPYLMALASDISVDDLDETTSAVGHLFRTEKEAVSALAAAMNIEFADTGAGEDGETAQSQNRETAAMFWGSQVCRSVLKNAAIDVTFALVDTAYGEYTATPEAIIEGRLDDISSSALEEDDEEEELDSTDVELDTDDESSSSEDGEQNENTPLHLLNAPLPKSSAGRHIPSTTHKRIYRGHCNVETTKDVNFFGLSDEYVVSGSDCGNLFIWDRVSTELLTILQGDNEVVNVIQGHPTENILAVSGIDHTVKVFSPDARDRRNARRGVGIERSDHSTFSSIGNRRRGRGAGTAGGGGLTVFDGTSNVPISETSSDDEDDGPVTQAAAPAAANSSSSLDEDNEEDDARKIPQSTRGPQTRIRDNRGNPLPSRKRMKDEYQIITQNDMDRRRGGSHDSAFLSRGMMALLAQRFRTELRDEGLNIQDLMESAGVTEGGEGDGCVVM